MHWELQRNDVGFGEMFMRASDPLWRVGLEFSPDLEANSGYLRALLMRLRGGANQLELHNWQRPAPVGTMRGTPTLASNVAAGATTIEVTGGSGQAGKTMEAGDLLGLGAGTTQQLVMVAVKATANDSGVISLAVQPPLRNSFSAGQSVVWDKPTALFRRVSNELGWDCRGKNPVCSGMTMDLVEDTRAA